MLGGCATLRLGRPEIDVAGDRWIALSTPHVHFETDVAAPRASAIAWVLEDTAVALYDVFPPCTLPSEPPPIEVMVFARTEDYRRFYRRDAAGHFGRGLAGLVTAPDRILSAHGDASSISQTLAHELTHQFISYCYPTAPIWLHEGLASYFQTLVVEPELTVVGRAAFRRAIPGRPMMEAIRGAMVMSVPPEGTATPSALLGMDDRAFYSLDRTNAGADNARHYAGAWALVHYGLLGPSPGARGAFAAFLSDVARGEIDPRVAFLQRFTAGSSDLSFLDEEVLQYFRRADYLERRVRRVPPVIDEPFVDDLPLDEVYVHWAEVLLAQPSPDLEEARGYLLQSSAVRSLLLLALLAEGEEREALLREARARAPEDLDVLAFDARLALGDGRSEHARALAARLLARSDLRAAETLTLAELLYTGGQAREALPHAERAVALRPSSVEALLTLGYVLRDLGEEVAAEGPLRRAVLLAPPGTPLIEEVRSWLASRPVRSVPEGMPAPPPAYGP